MINKISIKYKIFVDNIELKLLNRVRNSAVQWNFLKYLIDEQGTWYNCN